MIKMATKEEFNIERKISLIYYRVTVEAVEPGIPRRPLDTAERAPDDAVALETRPERQHPDPVAPLDPLLGLQVGQLVPNAAAGGVAEAVQRHP